LRLAAADERTLINRAKTLARIAQDKDVHCCSTAIPIWSRAPAPMARI